MRSNLAIVLVLAIMLAVALAAFFAGERALEWFVRRGVDRASDLEQARGARGPVVVRGRAAGGGGDVAAAAAGGESVVD